MEGLNLYTKKVKRVSFKTLTSFLMIMILPAIGGRIFLEMYWRHELGMIRARHAEILEEIGLDIKGGREDIAKINGLIDSFTRSYQILSRQRRDIIDFLKEAYASKMALSTVMNSISKNEDSWMILERLDYSDRKLSLVTYEIYSNSRTSDEIAKKLGEVGKVKKTVLFDVDMSSGKRMSKVVIDYEAR